MLLEQIRDVPSASGGTYGAPRVHAALADDAGVRVARLMRADGLVGVSRRRWRGGCTRRNPEAAPAADLVDRQFVADRPNELWVADVT